jgi:hypothetical protein
MAGGCPQRNGNVEPVLLDDGVEDLVSLPRDTVDVNAALA